MNVLKFELSQNVKSLVGWSVAILGTLCVFMLGIYPAFEQEADNLLEMMQGFPPQFLAAFGFDISIMFSKLGFLSFTFAYIGLIGAIMALSFGIGVFSKEKRAKCSDFLLSKPISRAKIFLVKLVCCGLLLGIFNILYVAVLYLFMPSGSDLFFYYASSLFFTQMVFCTIGAAVGVFAPKVRSVSGMATGLGIVAFAMSALANTLDKEWINFFAPLKYFDLGIVIKNSQFDVKLVVAAVVVTVTCTALAYIRYTKQDVDAI